MARRRKPSGWVTGRSRQAQLKIRLPEALRLNLELAARRAGRSLNAEAVWRLSESVLGNKDPYAIAAEAILNGLDQQIVTIIEDMILRANAEKEVREFYRKGAEEDLASGLAPARQEAREIALREAREIEEKLKTPQGTSRGFRAQTLLDQGPELPMPRQPRQSGSSE